jgi:hypothetical protein
MTRTLTVADRHAREREVDRLVAEGYRVLRGSDTETHLRDASGGSWAWHLIFLFMTLGIGNILYAIRNYIRADRVVVRQQSA